MKKIILKALNISAKDIFFGTDEDRAKAEEKEQQRAEEVEKLIFSPSFYAIEYYTSYQQRRILHKSTRNGIGYQLSYIDADGVPAMHENYIEESAEHESAHIGSKSDLLKHFVNNSNDIDLTLYIHERT